MNRVVPRLFYFVRPYLSLLFLAVFFAVATVGSGIALLGASAWLISAAALGPSIADLQVAIVAVRFFGIARGVFRYLERLISHTMTLRTLARLRVWFYQTLEPLSPARLYAYRSGDLLSRILADVETLEDRIREEIETLTIKKKGEKPTRTKPRKQLRLRDIPDMPRVIRNEDDLGKTLKGIENAVKDALKDNQEIELG